MKPTMKITYATMSADQMEDLHRAMDEEISRVPATFGRSYPMFINGAAVNAKEEFEDRSPIDTRLVLGRFQKGTREDVRNAIAAARAAYPSWSGRPWSERVTLLRNLAETIRAHRWELSVL